MLRRDHSGAEIVTIEEQSALKPNPGVPEAEPRDKPAEELLRKEAFNFALFQYNPAPTVVVDREGRTVKSNLARRHSREGLPALGKPLFDPAAGPVQSELHQALLDCIGSGEVNHFAEKEIGERFFSITMAPFPDGAIVTTQDITEQQQAREQLIQADKMVALGTLVSGVAHEISNPNNVLLLSSSALKDLIGHVSDFIDEYRKLNGDFDLGAFSSDETQSELRELVDTVTRAAERIRDTVNDLKEFARKSTTELTQDVDANRVVEVSARMLQPLIHKATRRFSLECAKSLPRLNVNAQRLEQVVVNLITNACQALTDPSQPVSVVTRHIPEAGCVLVEVRDGGQGIPEENLKRITDPFFTTKHDSGGTGLGLSISRKIVEQYGGSLRFASQPGKGTSASIVLPCAKDT